MKEKGNLGSLSFMLKGGGQETDQLTLVRHALRLKLAAAFFNSFSECSVHVLVSFSDSSEL